MTPRVARTSLVTLVLLLVAATRADAQARPATAPATKPAFVLAPFVDDTTLAVARADVTKLEWGPAAEWAVRLLNGAGLTDADRTQAEAAVGDGTARAKQWSDAWVAAGGGDVYLVGNFNSLSPVYGVVPLTGTADAEKLTHMLKQVGLANGINPFAAETGGVTVERVGDALVSGPPAAVKLAKKVAGDPDRVARADLAAALAAGGDGAAVRVAFCPPLHLKRALAINEPQLPPELGGGATGEVTDAFRFVTLSFSVPSARSAGATFRMTIQAADAAGANRLMRVIDAAIAAARKQVESVDKPGVERLAARLTPKVAGDRIELTFDQPAMEEASKTVALIVLEARRSAVRAKSEANMRQILVAMFIYSSANDDNPPNAYPADLLPHLGTAGEARAVITNPRWPDRNPGYVYVKPPGKFHGAADRAARVVLYEAHDAWPAGGISVGFIDGHVESVADEAAFKKMVGK